MLSQPFFKKLKADYQKQESERRQIISASNAILHDAKRSIFALHRGEEKQAAGDLKDLEKRLKELAKKFKFERLVEEGAFNAALEEYAEAKLFYTVMSGGKIDAFKEVKMTLDAYVGGLSDLTGELVRVATNRAAQGDFTAVRQMNDIINDIIAELVEFDLRGQLRNKYDQARHNLRKIEQIAYEVAIRRTE